MKKIITMFLALVMVMSLAACGGENATKDLFDMFSDIMGKNYSSREEVETAIKEILGEPTRVAPHPLGSDDTEYIYKDYELFGYIGELTVYVDPYFCVYVLGWTNYIHDEISEDDFGKMVSSFIQTFDSKYGRHSVETDKKDEKEYLWKDNQGFEYTLFSGKTDMYKTPYVHIFMNEANSNE